MMHDNESSTMVLRTHCFLCAFQGGFSTYATPQRVAHTVPLRLRLFTETDRLYGIKFKCSYGMIATMTLNYMH